MAWIPTVSDEQATGEAAEVLGRIGEHPIFGGRVPNVLRSLSLRPEVMGAHWELLRRVTFGGSGLGHAEEEMIATTVSALNGCHY